MHEDVFAPEGADDGQPGHGRGDVVHHRRAHHVLDVLRLADPRDQAATEQQVQTWRSSVTEQQVQTWRNLVAEQQVQTWRNLVAE